MEISETTLADIIKTGIEIGTVTTLTKLGLLKPYLSYKEAIMIYGRGTVDRWIDEGLVDKVKDGENTSKVRLSRERLEILSASANRKSWFKNKRKKEEECSE